MNVSELFRVKEDTSGKFYSFYQAGPAGRMPLAALKLSEEIRAKEDTSGECYTSYCSCGQP